MKPVFLRLDEVLEIHRDQVERYGGNGAIRDIGLLRSAIAVPQAGVATGYLHDDLYEMAAAYMFHIIQDHPFVDGNKRTGAVAAVVFLMMNGVDLEVDEDSFEKMVRRVAAGKVKKREVATFLRERGSNK